MFRSFRKQRFRECPQQHGQRYPESVSTLFDAEPQHYQNDRKCQNHQSKKNPVSTDASSSFCLTTGLPYETNAARPSVTLPSEHGAEKKLTPQMEESVEQSVVDNKNQSSSFPYVHTWKPATVLSRGEDYLLYPPPDAIKISFNSDGMADVDSGAIMLDANFQTCGDNSCNANQKENEVISIDLKNVPLEIHHIVLTMSVYTYDINFSDMRCASVRIHHGHPKHDNRLLCFSEFTEMSGQSLIVAQLTRKDVWWNLRSLWSPATGRTITQLLRNPVNLQRIPDCPSVPPHSRHIRLSVHSAVNLPMNRNAGIFSAASTVDLYYVITYKAKTHTSERKKRTLEPVWDSDWFTLGDVMETDESTIQITVYSYAMMSRDQSLGEVRLPVQQLYSAGPGLHDIQANLISPSEDQKQLDDVISGQMFLRISVEEVSPSEAMSSQPLSVWFAVDKYDYFLSERRLEACRTTHPERSTRLTSEKEWSSDVYKQDNSTLSIDTMRNPIQHSVDSNEPVPMQINTNRTGTAIEIRDGHHKVVTTSENWQGDCIVV